MTNKYNHFDARNYSISGNALYTSVNIIEQENTEKQYRENNYQLNNQLNQNLSKTGNQLAQNFLFKLFL